MTHPCVISPRRMGEKARSFPNTSRNTLPTVAFRFALESAQGLHFYPANEVRLWNVGDFKSYPVVKAGKLWLDGSPADGGSSSKREDKS